MSKSNPRTFRQQPVWRDQDALGHVNNAVYLTYIENAREDYWRAFDPSFKVFPFIMARVEIDYVVPITWRDTIAIKMWISRFGNSSFDFSYTLETADGQIAARSRSVQVMFDHESNNKLVIDDALRARFEAFENAQDGP